LLDEISSFDLGALSGENEGFDGADQEGAFGAPRSDFPGLASRHGGCIETVR
jgi:hypothetical protein